MFSFLYAPVENKELSDFVYQMGLTIKTLEEQATAFSLFGQTLAKFIEDEAPDYKPLYDKIRELYTNMGSVYSDSAKKVSRLSQDLMDIHHRSLVLKRLENEQYYIKAAFDTASSYADKSFQSMNPDKPDSVKYHEKMVENRAQAAKKLYDADKELLECRQKFHRFTFKRVKSSFSSLGQVISNIYSTESHSYSLLSVLFKTLRESTNGPECITALLENAKPAFISSEEQLKAESQSDDKNEDSSHEEDKQNEEEMKKAFDEQLETVKKIREEQEKGLEEKRIAEEQAAKILEEEKRIAEENKKKKPAPRSNKNKGKGKKNRGKKH